MAGQFRFVISTDRYDETVAFYRDRLGFAVGDSWDRSPAERGTIFDVGSGLVEVLWGDRAPTVSGIHISVEVDDVDTAFREAAGRDATVQSEPADYPWGHRGCAFSDPNGVVVGLFTEIGEPR